MTLVEYLLTEFPSDYKSQGVNLRSIQHDSLVVFQTSNRYFRFSNEESGGVIELLQKYHNYSLEDARNVFLSLDKMVYTEVEKPKEAVSSRPYDISGNNLLLSSGYGTTQAKAWLHKERCIPLEMLSKLEKNEIFYGNIRGDAVFVTPSKERYLLHPSKESHGSKYEFSSNSFAPWCYHHMSRQAIDVFITESPVDAISLALLRGEQPGQYYAMGGLKEGVLREIVAQCYSYARVTLAVDWDEAGKNFVRKLLRTYNFRLPSLDYRCLPTGTKDWSDIWQLYCRSEQFKKRFDAYKGHNFS